MTAPLRGAATGLLVALVAAVAPATGSAMPVFDVAATISAPSHSPLALRSPDAQPAPRPCDQPNPPPSCSAPDPGNGPGQGNQPDPGQANQPDPGQANQPAPSPCDRPNPPSSCNAPDPGNGPDPGQGNQPDPGQGNQPDPGQANQPAPSPCDRPNPPSSCNAPDPGNGPDPGQGNQPDLAPPANNLAPAHPAPSPPAEDAVPPTDTVAHRRPAPAAPDPPGGDADHSQGHESPRHDQHGDDKQGDDNKRGDDKKGDDNKRGDDKKGDDNKRGDDCRRHDRGERRRHHCDDEDEVDRTVIRLGGCKEFDKARGRAVFEDWDHRDDVFRVTVHDVDLPEDTELTVRVEGRKAGTFKLDDEGDGHLTRRDDDLPKFLRLEGDERVTVSRTTDDEDATKVVLSAACADHDHGDGD